MNLVHSSYKKEDCIFLLKDLTKIMPDTSFEEKEKRIAEGVNYSEMISKEKDMDEEVNQLFKDILETNKETLADLTANVAQEIMRRYGDTIVLVSLARAGTPVGILLKRYLFFAYGKEIPHYSISIIREKGIDENALRYILAKHPGKHLVFVDGWTGKGSICAELKRSVQSFNQKYKENLSDELVVLADPARQSSLCGTKKDVCIVNACLNSTVSGLVSRTILNEAYIGPEDFHGAKVYDDLAKMDYSNDFLDTVCACFDKKERKNQSIPEPEYVPFVLKQMKEVYGVESSKVKLSIGETSRALLRRKPAYILVKKKENPDLRFILYMAKKKEIPIREGETFGYECIGVLQ